MTQDAGKEHGLMTNEIGPDAVAPSSGQEPPAPAAVDVAPKPAAPTLVLRILSGLHTGASRVLGEQEMLLVGSGADCDIVLSDDGVAPHHVMLLRNGNSIAVRTIDAPAGFAGDPLYPGDPVELPLCAPVRLGEASFAVGDASDREWMPEGELDAETESPLSARPAWRPNAPKLFAGLAVLSVISIAIYAWARPAPAPAPRIEDQVAALVSTYGIGDNTTSTNSTGITVLTGTVPDSAARARIQKHVDEHALPVQLNLRTGEDVAADVAEVLRSQGITARTRYLGNGDVEASGRFEDQDKLRAAATSRAMIDVTGINRVIPRNFAEDDSTSREKARKPVERTRIVSVVGGDDSYVLAADGTRYPVGAELPDNRGTLVAIGKAAWALVDGEIRQVKPDPPVESEPPTDDAGASADERIKATAHTDHGMNPATTNPFSADTAATPHDKKSSAAIARQYTADNPRIRSNRM